MQLKGLHYSYLNESSTVPSKITHWNSQQTAKFEAKILNEDLTTIVKSKDNPLSIPLKNTEYLETQSSGVVSSGNNIIEIIMERELPKI